MIDRPGVCAIDAKDLKQEESLYCEKCGTLTEKRELEGRFRALCPACGYVRYKHLKVGAGVLVQNQDELLLVKRRDDDEAFPSTWGLPAGYCEADESPACAAAREAEEETGFEVQIGRLVDTYYFDDDPRGNGLLVAFEAELKAEPDRSPLPQIGHDDEIADVRFVSLDRLPTDLCGAGQDAAIRAWEQRMRDRWQPGTKPRFCPHCTHPLIEQEAFDRVRPICTFCGFVHFEDPKVGVSVLVEREEKLLLVQRAVEPGRGLWCLPSGFVEAGEPPEEAALREVEEETGIQVSELALLEVVHYTTDFRGAGINIVYRGAASNGELQAGDDAQRALFFTHESLPPAQEIAFAGHRRCIDAWKEKLC
jgi:ADP-ribose pyrophosphatase YjhB (NUDIX family)